MKVKASTAWPLFVAGILLVSVSVCTVTVIASLSDKSYAVESDYYERAVRWDETAREREASEELGWTSEASVLVGTNSGEVRLTLLDANGAAVTDASVRVEAFHHARRGDAVRTLLHGGEGGVYTAPMEVAKEGLWQVRVRAQSAAGLHVATHDVRTQKGDV